jgi:chemotaxis protein MotB
MNNKLAPIIIKKKRGHAHGGHHGGAWKVAYADFVTAMMAFFLVMWILGLSDSKKKAIAGYFRNPGLFDVKPSSETPIQISPVDDAPVIQVEEKRNNSKCDIAHPEGCPGGLAKNYQIATLGQELKDKLEAAAQTDPDLSDLKDAVTIELTRDGLRIEMTDSEKSTFFQVGGARPTKAATLILQQIAQELSKLPNPIELEGHTDRRPYPSGSYTNWDLSAERANAARRVLALSGVTGISQVSGLADTKLRNVNDPYDLSNRRVSILVRQ